VLFLFLGVGLFCLFLLDWGANAFIPVAAFFQISAAEKALADLDRGAARAFLLSTASPDPWLRLTSAIQLGQDLELRDRLQQHLDQMRRLREDRIQSFTWHTRQIAAFIDRSAQAQQAALEQIQADQVENEPADFRARAQQEADDPFLLMNGLFFFSARLPFILLAWPVAWVLWAFLARGGLSFCITGLALVRGDGRAALRIQCAWRALLVWLPITALLLLSAWCNATYWARWPDNSSAALLWFSCLSCWAALAMLLGFAALALLWPNRSLHDRLAGTYLVSR
jgi:hypothetical protein